MSKDKSVNIILWSLGGLVYLYILIRCFTVEPFIDEIWNYHQYVKTGDFNPFTAHLDANNHFISTFFNWLSYLIFEDDFIPMRIIESLFFLFYFYYLMKLKSLMVNKKLGIFLVLTLISVFFFNSFFSLARGYGMSLAFLLGVIYHLLSYSKGNQFKDVLAIGILGSLAIWTNLAFIPTIGIVYLIMGIFSLKNRDTKSLISSLLVAGPPFVLAAIHAFNLKGAGELYIGGKTGFFSDIVMNLPIELLGFKGVWIFLFWGTLTVLFIALNYNRLVWNNNSKLILLLFFSTVLSAVLMHLFLGVNYPQNRVALHFVLLGILGFYFLLDLGPKLWQVGLFPTLAFLIHSVIHFNFEYTAPWRQNVLLRKDISALQEAQKSNDQLYSLSAPFSFKSYFHYFNYAQPTGLNVPQWKDFPSRTSDYLLTTFNESGIDHNLYDTIYTNPVTDVTIFERKEKLTWQPLATIQVPPLASKDSEIILFKLSFVPELKTFKADFSGSIQSNDKDAIAFFVVTILDGSEKVGEEFIMLDRLNKNYLEPKTLRASNYFNDLPQKKLDIEISIYNSSLSEWNLSDFKVSLSQAN